MSDGRTVRQSGDVYAYDGSFDGLMCCVFESFDKKENPAGILPHDHTLLPVRHIATDPEKAERVKRSIPLKLGREAAELIKRAYLSDAEDKETAILRYMRLGYAVGEKIRYMLTDPAVDRIQKLALYVGHEKGLLVEFIRFSDYGGALVAQIDPNNYVLPLLSAHFLTRYPNEKIMIYDHTHAMALVCMEGRSAIIPVDELELPEPSEEEIKYRKLWRLFYDTVEVKERHNEKCRMSHMPKRYWKNMTEFCRD